MRLYLKSIKEELNMTQRKVVTRNCRVALENDELLIRGEKLTKAMAEIDRLDQEKKDFIADQKLKRELQATEIADMKDQIINRAEYRSVECEEKPDYERNMVEIVRKDTGQVVDQRKMIKEDRQGDLRLA
jgi:hypothetical protein